MYRRLLGYVLDHARAVVAIGILIQLLALACLPYPPKIYFDLSSISPENHEITATNAVADRLFGPSDYIVIGLRSKEGSIFAPAALDHLRRVVRTLESQKGARKQDITSILSERAEVVERGNDEVNISAIVKRGLSVAQQEARLRNSRIFRPLVSNDGRSTLILFRLQNPPEGKLLFVTQLREQLDALADPRFVLTLGGQPVAFAEVERFSQHIFLVLPFALVLIGLIHFEAFRSMQGLVFPIITAVGSATIATAIMTLGGMRLDAFNSAATILIVALTAGHAVQMLKRYCEALDARRSGDRIVGDERAVSRQAIEESFSTLAPIMAAASMVAALSFASLAVFKIPAIRGFGLFIAVGVFAGLVMELSFIPALRLLVRPPSRPVNTRETGWDRLIEWLSRTATPDTALRTLGVWLLIFAGCAYLGSRVTVNNSMDENLAEFTEFRQSEKVLNTEFSGANVIYVMFQGSSTAPVTSGSMAMLMRDMQDWLATVPEIGANVSYFDAVREVGCGFNDDYCREDAAYDTEAVQNFLATYELGAVPGALEDLVTPDKDAALIRILARSDSSVFVERLFADLDQRFRGRVPAGIRMTYGGTGATTLSVNDSFVRMKLINMAQILLLAALISAILFRSLLMGVLITVPLLVATVFGFAAMTLLDFPLNVATITIVAISVGIGADYAIYFGMRLRAFLALRPDDTAEAMTSTYRTAGKAVLFVASAVAGGFAGLIASIGYNVHLWLGVLVSLAMVGSALASLSLFPALLILLRPAALFPQREPEIVPAAE